MVKKGRFMFNIAVELYRLAFYFTGKYRSYRSVKAKGIGTDFSVFKHIKSTW